MSASLLLGASLGVSLSSLLDGSPTFANPIVAFLLIEGGILWMRRYTPAPSDD